MKTPRLIYLTLPIVIIGVMIYFSGVSQGKSCGYIDKEIQNEIQSESFIGIFRQATKLSSCHHIVLHKPATEFIQRCCNSLDKAAKLLHENGFKLSFFLPEYKPYYYPTENGRESFDDGVIATKSDWWDPFGEYYVTVLIRDEKVDRVEASYRWSLPLP